MGSFGTNDPTNEGILWTGKGQKGSQDCTRRKVKSSVKGCTLVGISGVNIGKTGLEDSGVMCKVKQ